MPKMRAWVASPEGPELRDIDRPEPDANRMRVRIEAAALNRLDLSLATGHAHGNTGGAGQTLGIEWAGTIDAVGSDVEGYTIGDRVMGMGGGAFADYVVAHPVQLSAVPADMPIEEAACLPVALRTMHDAVATNGRLERGQSVLVQGASSGVGLMGMQIAKTLGAGLVIGTSTHAERRAQLTAWGADHAIDPRAEGWVDEILSLTDGEGVDLVIDQISGDLVNKTMAVTKVLGRIVNVGRLGGNMAPFDAELHAFRRIALVGVTFRTRSASELAAINGRMHADLEQAIGNGTLRLPIAEKFAFDELLPALDMMRSNRHFGKIILGR